MAAEVVALTIREARADDAGALLTIINAAYESEAWFKNSSRIDEAGVADLLASTDSQLYVGEEAGEPVACVLYSNIDEDVAYMGLLSVSPAKQRRGIGRKLIAFIEGKAVEAGRKRLRIQYVNIRKELPVYYEPLGFAAVGEHEWADTSGIKPEYRDKVGFVDAEKVL
eukprot:PLAT227.17.p1 GENE.PLAT227.17~~PLAT227.17.p1  ORF type:complete len:168 (+),score=65.36 PLAT227.17:233-736(+)